MSAVLAPSRVSEIVQFISYWTKNSPHIVKCFFVIIRASYHVEKVLKNQSGLSKKQLEKLVGKALEESTFYDMDFSESAKAGHMLLVVEMLHWIRTKSDSTHEINFLCTTEMQRIKAEMQIFASDEQCKISTFDQQIIEQYIEGYRAYAEFDLNNRSSIQIFDPNLEKESIKVLLNHRTDCLIAHGSTTLH